MKKNIFVLISFFALISGCGDATGISVNSDFPAFLLQCISTPGGTPSCCDFLGGNGDGLVAAGNELYFIDRDAGYVKAVFKPGVSMTDVGSSPDGGYGLALTGNVLQVISNEIYTVHEQVLLPETGSFIVPRPSSSIIFVVCADGTLVKIETTGWTITKSGATDADDPAAAVLGSSGDYMFIADSNGIVYKISTGDFSTVASTTVDGGVNGMCTTSLGEVFVSPADRNEVWAIDCGTGQHSRTFDVPYQAGALAVTSSGKYFYAAMPNHGFAIVNTIDNTVTAVIDSYGDPVDMCINTTDTRAMLCTHELFILER